MSGLRGAVAFLTPVGGAAAPGPAALVWFPVVGAVIGALVGGVWWAASRVWPPEVAGGMAVATDLALTGLLHLDGLCDSADGLLPPITRQRRLEVMSAPDVGAFGVGAAVVVLLLRWASLAALHPAVVLTAALWAGSRAVMAVVVVTAPYARPEGGLASAFRSGAGRRAAMVAGIVGAVVCGGLALSWRLAQGGEATAGLVIGAGLVVLLAGRRLGGFTGDVLGAAGMVGETVGLVVACARW